MGGRGSSGKGRGNRIVGESLGQVSWRNGQKSGELIAQYKVLTPKFHPNNTTGRFTKYGLEIRIKGFMGGDVFGGIEYKIDHQENTARVVYINSAQALKGNKIGARLYAAAMLKLKEAGVRTFTSDTIVSESAGKAWRDMGKKLKGVVKETGKGVSEPYFGYTGVEPQFSADLRKVSTKRLKKMMQTGN